MSTPTTPNELDVLKKRLMHGPPIPIKCGGTHTESRRLCQMPAERLLFAGCVHEHIDAHFVCSGHSNVIEKGCTACWEAGHECPLIEIANPDVDVDAWLTDRLRLRDSADVDEEEWRSFVREHLHELIPEHLRTL
ncbi:hypothetical protein ACFYUV_20665 [Nonomuraea sp. NPDC003560]|uniref:hypothetical protein n=1 Tax=Nonomuraea sp. NPDC003560 TaxID=3364341 RepID=UPI0036B70A85